MIIGGFDCETILAQDLPFDPKLVALGQLKDSAKIADKIAKAEAEFQKGMGQLSKAMATDPARCQVITFVGIQYDTQEDKIIDRDIMQWGLIDEDAEYEVIWTGWEFIMHCYNNRIPLVSFNGIGFDLPVLRMAAMRNRIKFPLDMYKNITKKWEDNNFHHDLMLILAGWDKQRDKSLDFWLKRFEVGQKTEGMDGSKVGPAFLAGEYQKILEYCKNDVLSTCKLFTRIAPWVMPQKEGK